MKEIGTSSPYHWLDFCIGYWYQRGFGGEEKKNQAVQWLEKATHKGNTRAMYNLGVCYANGDLGVIQSFTKSNELYALAADKGNATARYHLGNNYRLGRGNLAIDFNRCVELWDQSAKQGFARTQFNLSQIYRMGSRDGPPMTIPVDPQLSFRWCLAAAKHGNVAAMTITGSFYFTGRGVEQNSESAFQWFMKAAEKGYKVAEFNVGVFYEEGRGCEIDLVQAMHWYKKSAAQEYENAIDAIERLNHNQLNE